MINTFTTSASHITIREGKYADTPCNDAWNDPERFLTDEGLALVSCLCGRRTMHVTPNRIGIDAPECATCDLPETLKKELAAGANAEQIGRKLDMKPSTVRYHIKKLNLRLQS